MLDTYSQQLVQQTWWRSDTRNPLLSAGRSLVCKSYYIPYCLKLLPSSRLQVYAKAQREAVADLRQRGGLVRHRWSPGTLQFRCLAEFRDSKLKSPIENFNTPMPKPHTGQCQGWEYVPVSQQATGKGPCCPILLKGSILVWRKARCPS